MPGTAPPKLATLRLARAAFEGLAPFLLRNGIKSPEAEALLRSVCVQTAARTKDESGRLLSNSQVSLQAGVNRHDVADILKQSSQPPDLSTRRDPICRVVDGWRTDPDYTENGVPKELQIGNQQTTDLSAWTLVQRYAPDVWPRLVIDELLRLDLVEALPNSALCLREPETVLPEGTFAAPELSTRMHDVMEACFHDLTQPRTQAVWRTAASMDIDVEDLKTARKMLKARLESMFAWIAEELASPRFRRSDGSTSNRKVRIGANGFMFEQLLIETLGNESGEPAKSTFANSQARAHKRKQRATTK